MWGGAVGAPGTRVEYASAAAAARAVCAVRTSPATIRKERSMRPRSSSSSCSIVSGGVARMKLVKRALGSTSSAAADIGAAKTE